MSDNKKNIEFIDLKAQYGKYKEEIDTAILNVCSSAQFILGKEVTVLEENLSKFTESKHAISLSSGTDALLLALMALDIKAGDEVITTPFTFYASSEVIAFLGAKPVFIDIFEDTYNMNYNQLEEKINSKTKAIMPISLYGQVADMNMINKIAEKHNIPVIEDACQSFGAMYNGKKSCNLSTIGTTSFFPSKPLGCYGDGGALFTNDDKLATKILAMRNHGQTERYMHEYLGINGRLDTIQAAVLNVKLKYFDDELKTREKIGSRYSNLINALNKNIVTPSIKDDRNSVYAQYSIRVKDRENVIATLTEHSVPTAIHYPKPLHEQKVFDYLGHKRGDFPISELVANEIMSLPMSPFLSETDQDYIVEKLNLAVND